MSDLTRVPGEAPPLVFITGASSGIGQALAQRYAQAGWRLALVARRGALMREWATAQSWPAHQWAVYEADVRHEAEVAEAVVYGVTVPGADGRAGMAALTLSDDAGPFDGAALAQALYAQLPRYAVPLFLRLRDDHVVTATFKYSKVALKREGYDPAVVHDALYVLTPGGYVPMTDTIWQALSAGTHRFD